MKIRANFDAHTIATPNGEYTAGDDGAFDLPHDEAMMLIRFPMYSIDDGSGATLLAASEPAQSAEDLQAQTDDAVAAAVEKAVSAAMSKAEADKQAAVDAALEKQLAELTKPDAAGQHEAPADTTESATPAKTSGTKSA
jgi:hypothetical protein